MSSERQWFELGPFTVFDVETTGLSPVRDRIVELAAVYIETDGSEEYYETLVNPGVSIPSRASSVHHITDEMVADAPTFHEVGMAFMEMARGSTLVAHNARFDLGFLQESLARTGRKVWGGNTMDTIPLVKQAYAGLPSYSLEHLRHCFELEGAASGQAHRAGTDVRWTKEILAIALTTLLERTKH